MSEKKSKSWPKRLLAAVTAINRKGAFATSGTVSPTPPGLDVAGVGPVGLPLSAAQAKELKQTCEQAGYGKGEKTIVDTSVRRVWRLKPEKFSLDNPAWHAVVADIVGTVQKDLGLDDRKLQPHLYDLLLYEKGGFFLPHRDGEKLDRMVATLVITLPSYFTGGELVVRHEGEQQVIDLGGDPARFQTQFAAFYADCEHEVKPVTGGHRLCLVYNLTMAESKPGVMLGAPLQQHHVKNITEVLKDWPSDGSGPKKIVLTLEHQYTRDGLKWDALKGIDLARARIIAEAAAAANCHANLALVTSWETGSVEGYYEDYSRGRWGGQSSRNPEDYDIDELIDSSLTADHWQSADGTSLPIGELPVEEDEIWPEGSLKDVKPEQSVDGYTGNEGLTLERWYRRAAVILWPDARHFDILCEAGATHAAAMLVQMTAEAKKSKGDKSAVKERLGRFAKSVLSAWPVSSRSQWSYGGQIKRDRASDPLPALDFLDDPALIHSYLKETLVGDVRLHPGGELIAILQRRGWAGFSEDLASVFERTTGPALGRNARLLDRLCRSAARITDKIERRAARDICRRLAESAVSALERIDADKEVWHRETEAERSLMLARLARAMLMIGADKSLSGFIRHVAATPARYLLQEVQIVSLTRLGEWLKTHPRRSRPSLSPWIDDVRDKLKFLTASIPQPPADMRRDAPVTCKCDDCAALRSFLADPVEQQHGFKMAQHRRSHLEDQIRNDKLDLDFVTVKRTTPQILLCTKNTASHERLLKNYHHDLKHLDVLRMFCPESPSSRRTPKARRT
jgi:predicted 2-oxoglutarate/Fe(II)-dependent dioxygenase YbiX